MHRIPWAHCYKVPYRIGSRIYIKEVGLVNLTIFFDNEIKYKNKNIL